MQRFKSTLYSSSSLPAPNRSWPYCIAASKGDASPERLTHLPVEVALSALDGFPKEGGIGWQREGGRERECYGL